MFTSPVCDGSGHGEGRRFLGDTTAVVDGTGHDTWTVTDIGTTVTPGEVVTATATDEDGNTSEFSQCFTVTNAVGPLAATINLTQDSANVRAGAQSVPIAGIDLGALTRGAGPNTASAPLDGIPLEGIELAGSPLEGIPLEGIGLTPQILNQALGGVHLSDIPLTPPASWPTLLAGTRLANVPLSTLTLADVLSLPTLPAGFHSITLGTIDLASSPLEGISLGGIALGPKLLSAVPLEGIATTTPAQNLQDWCDAINATPGYSCSNPTTTLANETVISQVVKGVPLEGIPLDGIPLEGIDLAGTPLEGIPLEGIDLTGTPLEGIPLEGINMSVSPLEGIPLEGINIIGSPLEGIPLEGIPAAGLAQSIVCTGGFCLPSANHTLGDAVNQNRVKPGATLGMLDGGYGDVTLDNLVDALKDGSGLSLADLAKGLPPGHTLHDLLAALLGSSAYDWSALNLNTFPIADFSSDGGVAHYHADFEVTGGALLIQPVTIHATLPAGGRYVPHSSVRSPGGAIADPTLGAGGQLSWSFNALRGQPYTLSWDVKPGLDLGSSAVGANIQLSNGTTLATPVATNVIQTFNNTNSLHGDTNDDPDTAPSLAGNSLYVSHLTKGDVDYYKIPIGPYGSRVEVTLSHIPAGSDYDLALAGPPAPRLRAAPANTIPLGNQELPDTQVELNHRDQPLPPEALQDVPTGELRLERPRSARRLRQPRQRSRAPVAPVAGRVGLLDGPDLRLPGRLARPIRARGQEHPGAQFRAVRTALDRQLDRGSGADGQRRHADALPRRREAADRDLRQHRPHRHVDADEQADDARCAQRRGRLGRPRRDRPGCPAAYNAWDASPCSPELANNVVRAIGSYLDTLQASAPNLKYIVVVGGDDIVPFARVPDNTEIANERTYRESLGQADNEYLASIGAGFLLTDDVWGEQAAPSFLGSELFVPELAVGRLVESPTDMGKTIDGFTAANGLLTPSSSLVTGYDFLTDGAQQINVPFAAGLGANAKTLINETWDRNALLAQLFPAGGGGPKLNSLNAHFDHQRLLPAAENAANRQSNLVTTADITARDGGPARLLARLSLGARRLRRDLRGGQSARLRLGAGDARPGRGRLDRQHRLRARRYDRRRLLGAAARTLRAQARRHADARPGARAGEAGLPRHVRRPDRLRREGDDGGHAVRPADAAARPGHPADPAASAAAPHRSGDGAAGRLVRRDPDVHPRHDRGRQVRQGGQRHPVDPAPAARAARLARRDAAGHPGRPRRADQPAQLADRRRDELRRRLQPGDDRPGRRRPDAGRRQRVPEQDSERRDLQRPDGPQAAPEPGGRPLPQRRADARGHRHEPPLHACRRRHALLDVRRLARAGARRAPVAPRRHGRQRRLRDRGHRPDARGAGEHRQDGQGPVPRLQRHVADGDAAAGEWKPLGGRRHRRFRRAARASTTTSRPPTAPATWPSRARRCSSSR